MTIIEMKQRKEELGYTYAKMAELTGVPLGTIQKIFNGETKNPRYDTLLALEELFTEDCYVCETSEYLVKKQGDYTLDDYYALPGERRVELIDGFFYDMSAPTTGHQAYVGEIFAQIREYIKKRNGTCLPILSPVDVQLDCDNKTMVQPDVIVICDRSRVKDRCIYGAPDFILEVVSQSSQKLDYSKKLVKYIDAGVREYWIIDPIKKILMVYYIEKEICPTIYGLDQPIPMNIFDGELLIDLAEIQELINSFESDSSV